jgi:hypothetical protein
MSPAPKTMFDNLEKRSKNASDLSTLAPFIDDIQEAVVAELENHLFLVIEGATRQYWVQETPLFGEKVGSVFLKAERDMSAAGRYLALDEWTACMFHLMRVVEHGLRHLAGKVGLDPDVMAHENWKNVIDQIEKKSASMKQRLRAR